MSNCLLLLLSWGICPDEPNKSAGLTRVTSKLQLKIKRDVGRGGTYIVEEGIAKVAKVEDSEGGLEECYVCGGTL